MASDWWGIVWLLLLLAANAFFVAAEFAILAARRAQVEPKAKAGNGAAAIALYAMEHATLMLACCQLGITVCSLLILNVSEPSIHHLLQSPLQRLGLTAGATDGVTFVVALLLVSFLHVTLGEMVPKNLSFSRPDSSVLILAPPLVFIARLLRPVIRALDGTANAALRLVGVEPKSEATSAFTIDQVASIVAESKRAGILSDESGTVSKAFEFTAKRAGDLAVPLARLVTLPRTVTPRQVEDAVARHGHSRYAVVDERGDLSGYVHYKDVIAVSGAALDKPLPGRAVRPLATVASEAEAEDALGLMRSSGVHLAVIREPDGAAALGVLFLEDIVEELIGEVRDASGALGITAGGVARNAANGGSRAG
ncbi:MAG TPA: hemolysin family protein [Trueperaceae bacterium]|nr:hemolysin family protein [Trueperaceae bacterium]